MPANVLGDVVNFGLMVLAGLYITLLGFRVVGTRPGLNPQVDAYRARWGPVYRIVGPLLIVVGLFLGLTRLFR